MVHTMPGLDSIVALHSPLAGRECCWAQHIAMVDDELLAEVAPVLDLFL
jgi:hypothetical protein